MVPESWEAGGLRLSCRSARGLSCEAVESEPIEDVFEIVGTVIADTFEVERVVAEGGFAVVYRAHHRGFRAPVALKCLKIPQHMNEDARKRFREQFRSEAELLFRLSASLPAVVRPLHIDAIRSPNQRFMPFLALEWLDGQTLEHFAAERVAAGQEVGSVDDLFELLTPAAETLARAHRFPGPDGEIAIVHRDIKPENLFLADVAGRRTLKILDFGIAKAKSVAEQIAGKTSLSGGVASFTPAYGAPEQWAPRRFGQTGPWTDAWGLALTFVELWAGRAIFDGDAQAVMGAVLDPERRPTPRNEGLPASDAVERVFAKALAVDPRERHRDVAEFWAALGVALENVPSRGLEATQELSSSAPALTAGLREIEISESMPTLELASIPPRAAEPQPPSELQSEVRWKRPAPDEASAVVPKPDAGFGPYVGPVAAIIVGIALSVLGQHYAQSSGTVLSFGPVELTWLTVPLVVSGSALLVWRLVRNSRRAH